MKKDIYNAVYRLFATGDYGLTITVGPLALRLCGSPETEHPNYWDRGVRCNGTDYTIEDLILNGNGPLTYAQLAAGEYDCIQGLTDLIYNNEL